MKRIFLFALFLVTACAPTPTPAPTLIATLVSSPTFTSTPAPTATITPSLTPSLPADVEAVLADEPGYQVFENDKIVSADGETLFRWVPEADRYDPSIEWLRIITFPLEGGGTFEMPRFETPKDGYDFIVKNGINWGDFTIGNNPDAADFFQNKIGKIPGEVGAKFGNGLFLINDESLKSHIMVYDAINGAIVVYQTNENLLKAIYINQDVSKVWAWLESL